jgi:phosphate acetyltransferase
MTKTAVVSEVRKHEKYERLVAAAKRLPALAMAVAHPCDETSLRGALEAADAGLIIPILVGPKDKIATSLEIAGQGTLILPQRRQPATPQF